MTQMGAGMSDGGCLANDPRLPIGEQIKAWREAHGLDLDRGGRVLGMPGYRLEAIEGAELELEQDEVERIGRCMAAWSRDAVSSREEAASLSSPAAGPALPAADLGGGGREAVAALSSDALHPVQPGALYPSILFAERCGAALASRGGDRFLQFQFAVCGAVLMIELPVEEGRVTLADAADLIAIHDNPALFEGDEA